MLGGGSIPRQAPINIPRALVPISRYSRKASIQASLRCLSTGGSLFRGAAARLAKNMENLPLRPENYGALPVTGCRPIRIGGIFDDYAS